MAELSQLPALLLPWYDANRRDLPWRRDRVPYHVWLSEIMLQQTRVEAVLGYYHAFLQRFPDLATLAAAPEDELLKLWEGLGYYNRAHNLQKAAQYIVTQLSGHFPESYEAVLSLPGVGAYTAGAICSICFEQPTAAVDGNVLRVLSRYAAIDTPITSTALRRELTAQLSAVYPVGHCGSFTQALMELGATVCLPNGAPRCARCPLAPCCAANAAGTQLHYPVKGEKKHRRREARTVFLLQRDGMLALCRRPPRGLLAGLWQFPDVPGALTDREALHQAEQWGLHPTAIDRVVHRQHIFTHVEWQLTGVYLRCAAGGDFCWYTPQEIAEKISLPTAYRQFLTD